jgi:IS30 family transposase
MARSGRPRNEALRAEVLELLKAGLSKSAISCRLRCSRELIRSVEEEHGVDLPALQHAGRPRDLELRRRLAEVLRAGSNFATATRILGCCPETVRRIVVENGGMLPPLKERSPLRLSVEEREEIALRLVEKWSFRRIARHLDRDVSTISREVGANGGRDDYRAWAGERRRHEQAKRPKVAKLARCPELRAEVERRLEQLHSPRQIALCLMAEFDDPDMHVSHEAIYQALFVQGRGALRRELSKCLRTGRILRKPHRRERKVGKIVDMVMISERPAEVEDRAVPGHWEGDLIIGAYGQSAIATLVERSTRYVMLAKVDDQRAETVRVALEQLVKRLPAELFKSLTWDQGREMSEHAKFKMNTQVDVYFCDPHSPWQRGSNENTNGLLRQYFPKGTELSHFTQEQLDAVARQLNERPRETLGLKTPAYMLNQLIVALTG